MRKRKIVRATSLILASAGGLTALAGTVTINKTEGVTFGKSISLGVSQASACTRDNGSGNACGCSQGCGVR